MRIGLFVPCFIDLIYPEIGIATLELLERFGLHDQAHEPMHDRFLWATMQRRDAEAAAIPEWEELRETSL